MSVIPELRNAGFIVRQLKLPTCDGAADLSAIDRTLSSLRAKTRFGARLFRQFDFY